MQTAVLPWRRIVLGLALAVLAVLLLSIAGQYSRHYLGHDHVKGILPRLDVNEERSLPTGLSAALLTITAVVTGVVALLERARRSPWTRHWTALVVLLGVMSLEEVSDFHTIQVIPREPAVQLTGFLHMTWVIFGIAFVLAFAAIYLRFWWRLPPRTRLGCFLAGALYVGGAVAMEMIAGNFYVVNGSGFGLGLMLTLEEGLEFAGVLALLATMFDHLEHEFGTVALALAVPQPARAPAAVERQVPLSPVPAASPAWTAGAGAPTADVAQLPESPTSSPPVRAD